MRKILPLLALSVLSSPFSVGETNGQQTTDNGQRVQQLREDVEALTTPEMEGRGVGTKGIERAAKWIEARLRKAGLEPAFGKEYRQKFPIKTGVARGADNRLSGVADSDWTPLGFSGSGSFNAPLVFAGYGIEAPELDYRELQPLDLKGKVVLMLRYEPQERDEKSKFDGRRPSRWSAMRYKVLQARERGAAAVVFTTGPLQDEGKDKVPALVNDGPESPAGIPVIQVKHSVAQRWLGLDLAEWQKNVDATVKPDSRAIDARVSGKVDLRATFADGENVAGMIPGRGPLAADVVVLGAHYDHLGFGGRGSMRPNSDAIHHGADDNASGTVAVIRAAERMRELLRDSKNHRTVVFALFSGEEVGLAGSSFFVANPPRPMDRVVAMINLDMVGRLRDRKLMAFGTDSAAAWAPLVERIAASTNLAVTSSGDGYGPSDQTSFYSARIPVVHLFTGAHDRYHTPDDVASSLNYEGLAQVVDFTANLTAAVARGDVTPSYVRASAAPTMQGDGRGYGAYLGTVPDYTAMQESSGGVLLSDVRPGGPADLAGIRGGDRLVEMAGTRIENLYDMTFALQDHKPGDTVDVVVLRKGERNTLRATLGSRSGVAPPTSAAHAAASPHQAASPHATASGRSTASLKITAGKPFEKTFEGEKHLRDIRQLTFGGENAEAYFSGDGTKLIYQATREGDGCDQIYTLDLATGETKRVSSGKGRTTCSYFSRPSGNRILYSSTESGGDACPSPPDRSQGYVWAIYDTYDIYEAKPDGSDRRPLTSTRGYDAEATACDRDGRIVFTSMRDGDLDIYDMDAAGKVRRLTSTPGYDGGPFYNADCTEIVFRASRPQAKALEDYQALLEKGLVRPTALEIYTMKSDGTGVRQVTSNGAANFAPFFHPDGKRIIYSSNAGDPRGREFDMWLVGKNGGEAERVTTAPGFDGFPMWTPDGQYLVWASNRANPDGRDTNLFIGRWVE